MTRRKKKKPRPPRRPGKFWTSAGVDLHQILAPWEFDCVRVGHESGLLTLESQGVLLVLVTWVHGSHSISNLMVDEGLVVFSDSIQVERRYLSFGPTQLPAEERAHLEAIVRDLPDNHPPPTLDRVILVSFRDARGWNLRIYDRESLPPGVGELQKLDEHRIRATKRSGAARV